jgi:hypothetical protein
MSTQFLSADRRLLASGSAFVENVVAVMIATLVLAVFICVSALVPVVGRLAGGGTSSVPLEDLRHCAALTESRARLTCYDDVTNRPLPHPAKGANAPADAFGARH